MELWFPIPGWADFYEVSEAGRVRSVDRVVLAGHPLTGVLAPRRFKGRVLKPNVTKNGYFMVSLSSAERGRLYAYVHDLVAATFIGPKPDAMEVCHGDGVRTNNAATNLRYDTRRANALDRHAHGTMNPLRGEAHASAKLDERAVRWVLASEGRFSQRTMGRRLGVCHKTVGAVLSGESGKHVEDRK